MNEKMRYKEVFSKLHASENTVSEVLSMTRQSKRKYSIKKAVVTLAAAVLILGAVTVAAVYSGLLIPDLDPADFAAVEFQKNMHGGDFSRVTASISSSDDFYHIITGDSLYNVNRTTMDSVISCSKAGCTHKKDDYLTCDAFISPCGDFCGNKMFSCDFDPQGGLYSLFSADIGGSGKKLVQALQVSRVGTTRISNIPFAIHRGNIIFQTTEGDYPRGANVYIGALGVDAKNAKKLLSYETSYVNKRADGTFHTAPNVEYSPDPIEVWDMWADGNYFYYVGVTKTEGGVFKQVVYRYDPASEENVLVWKMPDPYESTDGWYIDGGVLYYFISGSGVWKCNLETGIDELLFAVTDDMQRGKAAFDGEYVYINNGNEGSDIAIEDRAIYVYNLTGEHIATIPCSGLYQGSEIINEAPDTVFLGQWTGIMAADENNIFIGYYGYGQDMSETRIYYIEKNNLQNGSAKLLIIDNFRFDPETGLEYQYKS